MDDNLKVTENETVIDTLPESIHETTPGTVTVILGTAGQTAVEVEGEGVTVAQVLQRAAQAIDPSAQLVTLVDGRLTFAGGEVYLVRAGSTVSGEGLNEVVQDGDVIATGERHHNG